MKIPNTDIALDELLDQMPVAIHFVSNDGVLRYQNKAAAALPARGLREVGVNIKNCHANPASLETIVRIFDDFRRGRLEPHYHVTPAGQMVMRIPVYDATKVFAGILSYVFPVGRPPVDRTF